MYANFFGLNREPFSLAPDPRYLFMSERHREALAHLLYGVSGGGGFVLLSGEIGAGKTTVCRCFLEQIPKRCNVGYIFNPKLTVIELLRSVCEEFRIPVEALGPDATIKDYVDPLNQFLLKTHAVGQNNVLIIDEAQNLSADVLEQLRLLTNLETNERKLLQIVLIGQPELRDMLARPELEQLAQRVIARFHLEALTEVETGRYIRHRLSVAGLSRPLPFEAAARKRVHQLSRGIPRRINLLCDRALLGAYASGKARVDRQMVDKAAQEVFDTASLSGFMGPAGRQPLRWVVAAGAGLIVCGAVAGGFYAWRLHQAGTAELADSKRARGAAATAPAASASASAVVKASPTVTPAAAPTRGEPPVSRTVPTLLSEGDAWRALGRFWKLKLREDDPCQAAQSARVQCFRSGSNTNGLGLVRQLGRPGLIALQGEDGRPGYAVMTGLTPMGVTLQVGDTRQTLPMDVLAKRWRGEFATFWRLPPGYEGRFTDGTGGGAVDWLAARLAAAQGAPAPTGEQVFDAELKSRVQSFQMGQGMKPDGIAGPVTLMLLNRAAGVDEPRLQTGPSGP